MAEGSTVVRSCAMGGVVRDRKSTRLNSSHVEISYAVFCLKKKKRLGQLRLPDNTAVTEILRNRTCPQPTNDLEVSTADVVTMFASAAALPALGKALSGQQA